jgi:hypothetical protein
VPVFAVTTVHGPQWDPSRPIREQQAWDDHAIFMDGLVDEGFVILGGPIDEGREAMLAVEAADENEIRSRMARDPWAPMGLLIIGSVRMWTIWLDGRHRSST